MKTLGFYKLHPDVKIPELATEQSACFDLAFHMAGNREYTGYNMYNAKFTRGFHPGNKIYFAPGDRILVPTGLILDIPVGHSVRIHARSGLSLKQGFIMANSEGVIDSDYFDPLYLLIYNRSDNGQFICEGDRMAQGELVRVLSYVMEEVATKPKPRTSRKGGLGSTGVNDGETSTSAG